METATQEAQGRVHGLAGPFLSLSSSAEEDGGAGGYGRRDGGLKAWYLLIFFFGLEEEEEEEEEKEEEDEDELVSWDDVVVSWLWVRRWVAWHLSHAMLGAIPGFWAVACAGLVLLVAPRSVLPVVFDRPEMLCIMALLGQKGQLRGDISLFFLALTCARLVLMVFYTSRWVPLVVLVGRPAAGSASWCGPEGQLRRYWWHIWQVLLVTLHLVLFFFPCRQAQDALHHGRY